MMCRYRHFSLVSFCFFVASFSQGYATNAHHSAEPTDDTEEFLVYQVMAAPPPEDLSSCELPNVSLSGSPVHFVAKYIVHVDQLSARMSSSMNDDAPHDPHCVLCGNLVFYDRSFYVCPFYGNKHVHEECLKKKVMNDIGLFQRPSCFACKKNMQCGGTFENEPGYYDWLVARLLVGISLWFSAASVGYSLTTMLEKPFKMAPALFAAHGLPLFIENQWISSGAAFGCVAMSNSVTQWAILKTLMLARGESISPYAIKFFSADSVSTLSAVEKMINTGSYSFDLLFAPLGFFAGGLLFKIIDSAIDPLVSAEHEKILSLLKVYAHVRSRSLIS